MSNMSQEMADYAVTEKASRGRQHPEDPHSYRSPFERDRDRVIHCSAFRRLEGKTQVFTPGLDDYYRTRLTHTIEVAQIGRTIAKALRLNESLTEAICLAHDLGHSPFGHAGEKALNQLAADVGGFEHNRQSLRIVELLEHPRLLRTQPHIRNAPRPGKAHNNIRQTPKRYLRRTELLTRRKNRRYRRQNRIQLPRPRRRNESQTDRPRQRQDCQARSRCARANKR
ncbi:MAG: dGTP triphosphohydrolase [Planctomycetota bacterium]